MKTNRYAYEIEGWKAHFPELHAAIHGCQSMKELNRVVRLISKKYDEDMLEYSACYGAILAFKAEAKESFIPDTIAPRSAQDARINRIATTTTSNGQRQARRWN